MANIIEYFSHLINPKLAYESITENEEIEYLRMVTNLPPEEILRLRQRFDELVGNNHLDDIKSIKNNNDNNDNNNNNYSSNRMKSSRLM